MHRQGYVNVHCFVLWLNCVVFVCVYCPTPCVDYADGVLDGVCVLECVVELSVVLVLVYSLSL